MDSNWQSQINKKEIQFIENFSLEKKNQKEAEYQNQFRTLQKKNPIFLRCLKDSYYKGLSEENKRNIKTV